MAYTTIDDPSAHFQTVIYTGNGGANHAITNDGNSDLQPDFVWIKNRDAADSNCLFDSSRGATNVLSTDSTDNEDTDTDTLDSFASDGFQVDADVKVNTNTEKYVAWQWKANGGSLTSVSASGSGATNILAGNYQANTTAGFSIMTFTGDETQSTVTHGLGAAPDFIVVRARTRDSNNWIVWHSAASTGTQYFNATGANDTSNGPYFMGDNSNITQPTSTVFTVGANIQVNHDGASNIAYAWRSIQGYSKFGKYVGNGAEPDGPFIYTGFSPAFIMVKAYSEAGQGYIIGDHKRDSYNMALEKLFPNVSAASSGATGDNNWDFLSNGFKIRTQDAGMNWDGRSFFYAAFAHQPFVTSDDGGSIPATAR